MADIFHRVLMGASPSDVFRALTHKEFLRAFCTNDMTVKLSLTKPDISIIPGICDYVALIVHKSFDEKGGDFKACPIGTGPFELVSYDVGQKVVYKRRADDKWWD